MGGLFEQGFDVAGGVAGNGGRHFAGRDGVVRFQVFLQVVANLVAKIVRAFVGEFEAGDLLAELQNPGGLLRLSHVLGAVGSVVEADHHLRLARFARFARGRDGRADLVFGTGLATHFRYGCAEALPEDADYDVALLDRQVFVNRPLRALLVNTGTDVGLPAEHSELHIAFRGCVAVEGVGDAGDMIPLGGDVPGGSDEQGDDPDH